MFVMTHLVRSIWGKKLSQKQVFLSIIIFFGFILFFYGVQSNLVLGQGLQGTPGIDRPFRPGERPDPVIVPTSPSGPSPQQASEELATDRISAEQAAAQAQAIATSENMGATPDGVLGFIHTYVLTGIGWVVGQAGKAFDYAISEFIVGFGRLYITGTGETIDALWGTVRDIFNLTFIFGLVYIGFKMILDSSDSSARKMLVSLIGAALLVNFSLFITKFVIDFSNIAATQVYNAFESSGELSITNGFMTVMGITSMMTYEYTAGGSFAYVIGMLLVFSVLAYVFLAGAIMIIIRFVALNIYMVFSPFMFLGWVFPALQGYSRDYWSGFLRQAFFAPAFIFMLYLSYQVASTFPVQRDLANMFNPNGSTVSDAPGLIPYFALVIVFLCASMIVAKKMGAHGSTMAISVGNKLRGNAQGFMYRNTGGRLAKGALNVMDRSGISNLPGTRSLRSAIKSGYEYGAGGTSLSKTRSDIKAEKGDIQKNRVRMNAEVSEKQRATNLENQTAALQNNALTTAQLNDSMNGLATTIREMSDDERSDLSIGQLTNHHIASNLTDAHITALEKNGNFGIDDINRIRASRRQAQINTAEHGFATTSTVGGQKGASNAAVRTGGAATAHQGAQRQRLLAGGDTVVGNMPVVALSAPEMLPYITPRIVEARMKNGMNEQDRIRLRDAVDNYRTMPGTPQNITAQWNHWEAQSAVYGREFFR